MGFADLASQSRANHQSHFGESIEYQRDSAASWEPISGILHPEQIVNRKLPHGWAKVATREIVIEPSSTAAPPRLHGAIRLGGSGGTLYTIEAIGKDPSGRISLSTIKASAGEVSRPNYRG